MNNFTYVQPQKSYRKRKILPQNNDHKMSQTEIILIKKYKKSKNKNNFIKMTQVLANNSSIINYNKMASRSKSQNQIRNYSNPQYHTAIDLAKAYSGMVDSHLYKTKYENHQLKSASRTYQKQAHLKNDKANGNKNNHGQNNNASKTLSKNQTTQLKRARSASNYVSRKGFSSRAIKPIKIQNNRIVYNFNPQQSNGNINNNNSSLSVKKQKQRNIQSAMQSRQEQKIAQLQKIHSTQLKSVLQRKTQRVPQYSQQVQQVCHWKISLQQQIKNLKKLINAEKKQKAKISLNCNKIMNDRQNTYKTYQVRAEQNYHLGIAIDQTIKEIDFLTQELEMKTKKNEQTKQAVGQTQIEVYEVKKFVDKTRLILMGEEKDVAKLKSLVTISFNNMSNNHMNMNLLKGQKALLLADIDANHAKNR